MSDFGKISNQFGGGIGEGIIDFLNSREQDRQAQLKAAAQADLEERKMKTLMAMKNAETDYAADVQMKKSIQLEQYKAPTQMVYDPETGGWKVGQQGGPLGEIKYETATIPKEPKSATGEADALMAAKNVKANAADIKQLLKDNPDLMTQDSLAAIQRLEDMSTRAAQSSGVTGIALTAAADAYKKKIQTDNPKAAILAEKLGKFVQFLPNIGKSPRVNPKSLEALATGFSLAKNTPEIVFHNIDAFEKVADDISASRVDNGAFRAGLKPAGRKPVAKISKKTGQPEILYQDENGDLYDSEAD